ncbi:chemotaxis protein CheW [Roseateles koreensis]|uniref:Chemotaxis protein CheW n=1 Tax=Roseateles koreensis TaxID=2987526 RepID=A0ABT5KRM8_9BURK|nr:chemotaxis protein CheW [Roseateles koreensis]MDC8785574.1 chemotaxis protein CheW [Roseateles koreensis]
MQAFVAPHFADEPAAPERPKLQCVTFNLGGELFGIEIRHVREIVELDTLTAVPMMPPFVRGIINLRGRIVPVIDLALRFGQEATALQASTCVAVLRMLDATGACELGVLLDSVGEVLDIPLDELDPAPSFGARIRAEFIQGIATLGQRPAVILDAERALSLAELAALAEALLDSPPAPQSPRYER